MHPATVPAPRADRRPRRLPPGLRAEEVGLGRLADRLRARERPGPSPAGDLGLEAEDPQGRTTGTGSSGCSARRSGSPRPTCPPGVDLIVVPRGPGLTFEQARRSLPSLARAVARRLGLRRREVLAMIGRIGRLVERAASRPARSASIRVYQWTLSPLLGPACRFEPTCSRYMIGAIRKYGLIRGVGEGLAAARAAAIPGIPAATTRPERPTSPRPFPKPRREAYK